MNELTKEKEKQVLGSQYEKTTDTNTVHINKEGLEMVNPSPGEEP